MFGILGVGIRLVAIAALFLSLSPSIPYCHAEAITWTGGTEVPMWDCTGNWSTYTCPVPTDDVSFVQDGLCTGIRFLDNLSVNSLNMDFDSADWSLGNDYDNGYRMTLNSGQISVKGLGNKTVSPRITIPSTLSTAQWDVAAGNSLALTGGILFLDPSSRVVKTGGGEFSAIGLSGWGTLCVRSGTVRIGYIARGNVELTADAGLPTPSFVGPADIRGSLCVDDGLLTPGDNGVGLLCTGSLTLVGSSRVSLALTGTGTEQYGRIQASGQVDLSDAPQQTQLAVSLGFAPTVGQSFVLIANDSIGPVLGEFAGLAERSILKLPFGPATYNFRISYCGGDGNDVVLTALPQRLPGDANSDGFVDQLDYEAWYNHYAFRGQTPETGDFSGDGLVDQVDYEIWYNNYGGRPKSEIVPEVGILGYSLTLIGGIFIHRQKNYYCKKSKPVVL